MRTLGAACLSVLISTIGAQAQGPDPGAGAARGPGVSPPACCMADGGGNGGAACCGACCEQAQKTAQPKPAIDAVSAPAEAKTDADTPSSGMHGMMTSAEHDNIFNLLSQHAAITRKVEDIPGGVKTTTTTSDPALVGRLRQHVRQMNEHLEQNRPVRLWDPVFQEVFARADKIDMVWTEVEGGLEVTETSADPEAVKAIRAHARKVDSFVAGGHAAARPPWAGGGRGPGAGAGAGPGAGGPGQGAGQGRGRGRMMGRGPGAGGP